MAAGDYRERVTIYAPAPTVSDGMGGRKPASSETTLETWAAVEALRAREFFENGKLYTKQPYRIRLRYVNAPGLDAAQRVVWENVSIAVTSVTADAKKTELTIYGYAS